MAQQNEYDEIDLRKVKKETAEMLVLIGKNIKKLRENASLSQMDIGFYIFADKSSISDLERGVPKNITLLTLKKLATLFDVKVEELFKEIDESF